MFKQIKLGLNMIKYGYRLGVNNLMLFIFLAIGLLVEVSSKGTNLIGGFYFLLIGLFVYQLITSLTLSHFVQASPAKKRLQINIPVITSTMIYLIIFTILLLERVVLIQIHPELQEQISCVLLNIIIFLIMALIYSGICYKLFVAGTALFLVLIFTSFPFVQIIYEKLLYGLSGNVQLAILAILGYIGIILGGLLEYGIGCLLYKKPLSEFAFKGLMKGMK